MKLGQEMAAIRPAPSLKAYSIHLGDIQGNRRKACPSKLPARESWLLSLQKIGSEMVSLAPPRVSVWLTGALSPLHADDCRIARVRRCSNFGQ